MRSLGILMVTVLFLAGCGPVYKTDYRFTPPQTAEGRSCANNCLDALHSCTNQCAAQETECRRLEKIEAERDYYAYLLAQKIADKEAEKDLNDFTNYSHCRNSCKAQCEQSQRICHTNCGGDVVEHRYCTAFCD